MRRAVRHLPVLVFFLGLTTVVPDRAPAAEPGPRVQEVVVVFKTHFDIGYTDMAANVVRRYQTGMIDQALTVVDQNRNLPPQQQFAWTIPGWPMKKIVEDWEGQKPERKQKIRQAFKDGRFVVHSLPFTLHTELFEPEDLVRGLIFASALSREAGLPLPRDAKMTDVAAHVWILPTLLRNAGVDFLHIGCNAACTSPEVPRLFWWQGPDGSRLLTMYTAEGYGTDLVPPGNWPHKTWLALIHTGDNHGPPTPAEVKKLLDDAAKRLPGVKVRIGRLSDFADAILAEKAELPVVRGDTPDTWIHGPLCDPAGARWARGVRPAIGTTDALHTLLGAWGVQTPSVAGTIAKAYEQSLLYGEHTWGGAQYWITQYGSGTKWAYGDGWKADRAAGRFKRLEESWAEHTSYIEKARDLIVPLLDGQMQTLAKSVAVEGQRVVVFNPLPWKRDGEVTAKLPGEGIAALKPVDGGQVVPVAASACVVRFVARDVPGLGYRTYVPAQAADVRHQFQADEKAATLENGRLKLTFDPARGVVRSMVDKRSGRELVDAAGEHGFGQYLYERFDASQVAAFLKSYVKIRADWADNEIGKPKMPPAAQVPYRAASPRNAQMRFERTATSIAAVFRSAPSAELGHAITTRFILHADEPYLDVEVTAHDKPADPWPEAAWLCLPLKVESPQFRLGRPGSIIDPAKDIIRGANRHLFGIHTGVAIFDGQGRGAGLCSIDSPLVSLDTPGGWKFSMDFLPKKPAVYVNLFNNQWTTNFRMWNEGTWTWRVRVWPIERYDATSGLITPSLEARYPLLAAATGGSAGRLPAVQKGVEVSRQGVLVTAFGANPDGPGSVLRLWELSGAGGSCQVRLPQGISAKTVQPVDLRGQPAGQPIAVENGAFPCDLRALAPMSFVLP